MTEMGEYEVVGKREYRGHSPGTIFEARIDRAAVSRAISRGDIRLLRMVEPVIQSGSFALPDGWLSMHERSRSGLHEEDQPSRQDHH